MGKKQLTEKNVIAALQTVMDPEIDVDVWTMGLIYRLDVKDDTIDVDMTFTTPLCPYGPELVKEVREKLLALGAKEAWVNIVSDPPWKPPEALKEMLGLQ